MIDILQTGGAGLGGSVIGAIAIFLGFKSRIDNIEKLTEKLSEGIVSKDLLKEKLGRMGDKVDHLSNKIDIFLKVNNVKLDQDK